MSPEPFNLESLLSPLALDQFFENYWERNHLHLRRGLADYYQRLLTAADLERIVSNPDARFPAIQLAKGGKYLAAEAYTRDVKFGSEIFVGVPDLQRISIEYRNGASIVLPALHRTWPALKDLCTVVEIQLDHVPHANVYVTPGNAAGFTPHYDVHEIFVLQVAGKKRWSLYPATVKLPLRTQPFMAQGYGAPAPIAQVDLNPGDLLYLPRGCIHSAVTLASFSAHITIGIRVYTWADLTKDLIDASAEDERLREALPPGFAKRAEFRPILKEGLAELLSHRAGIDYDELINTFSQHVRSGQIAPPEKFRIDVVAIDARSPLQAPSVPQYCIAREPANTILEFKGKRHTFPAAVASTLGAMTERKAFRTEDLPEDLPAEVRLGLSRYLLDIGFLTLVSEDCHHAEAGIQFRSP